MDLEAIDRRVVRHILERWPNAQTGAELAAMGYDKEMIREEFRAGLRLRLADSAGTDNGTV